jgi:hypothetical protein
MASGETHDSKSGSYNSADMGEAEDKIKAPSGREILSAKHRVSPSAPGVVDLSPLAENIQRQRRRGKRA